MSFSWRIIWAKTRRLKEQSTLRPNSISFLVIFSLESTVDRKVNPKTYSCSHIARSTMNQMVFNLYVEQERKDTQCWHQTLQKYWNLKNSYRFLFRFCKMFKGDAKQELRIPSGAQVSSLSVCWVATNLTPEKARMNLKSIKRLKQQFSLSLKNSLSRIAVHLK